MHASHCINRSGGMKGNIPIQDCRAQSGGPVLLFRVSVFETKPEGLAVAISHYSNAFSPTLPYSDILSSHGNSDYVAVS